MAKTKNGNTAVVSLRGERHSQSVPLRDLIPREGGRWRQGGSSVDRGLLENLRDGDATAFETLYSRYVRPVTNYLTTFVRSADAGREVAQDVFVKLWERREGINPDKDIVGYLFTMARNGALDLIKDEKRYASESVEAQEQYEDTLSFGADIEYIALEAELILDIAVGLMPPKRRKIYELSRKELMSNTQIAELMGISKNTVENQITTALNDLRRTYAEYMNDGLKYRR